MTEQVENNKRSLKTFWILLAVCGLPYALSWFYFANQELFPEKPTSNRGELIEPVRPIEDLSLQLTGGEVLETNHLKGNWILMTAGSSECAEPCQRNVYHISQIRRLMGEERTRIKRVFVLLDEEKLADFSAKVEAYGEIDLITASAKDGSVLLDKMTVNGVSPKDRIFIVDPMTNLMMAYQSEADPLDIAKDFKRLLKISRIGKPKTAG